MFNNDENPNELPTKIPTVNLAKETRLPLSTIHRALKRLEVQGYIRIIRPKTDELKEQGLIKCVDKGESTPSLPQEELWRIFQSCVVKNFDLPDGLHEMMMIEDNNIDKSIEYLNEYLQLDPWINLKSRIVRTYKLPDNKHSMIMLRKQ